MGKTFLVGYDIIVCGHLKQKKVLVDADCSENAVCQALLSESDCLELLDWESVSCVHDDCGRLCYRGGSCFEVSGLELNVLAKHLSRIKYDSNHFKYAGNYAQLFEK